MDPSPTPVLLLARELGVGGSERQLTETARGLDRSRFTPHVGCLISGGLRQAELAAAQVPVVTFPVSSFLSPSALQGAWLMRHYVRQYGIQIVHSFDVPMNVFGAASALAARAPVVLISQRAHQSLTPFLDRCVLRYFLHPCVHGIVVNCQAMRRHLIEDEGVSAERIYLCYNGLDTATFFPAPTPRPDSWTGATTIGVVCALRPEKDLPTLLRAFAQIHPQFPQTRLIIVGSGSEESLLKRLAAELGISSSTHFEPATAQVAFWLRRIDIFVLPSLSEALSNSLMEAMACGCCPVASHVGGNPELVEPGQTGLLFTPGDSAHLAAQLRFLLQHPQQRQIWGRAAAHRIATHFTHQAAVKRMAEIYTTLLEARRRRRRKPLVSAA